MFDLGKGAKLAISFHRSEAYHQIPKLFDLRTDPYEFADITSNSYYDWYLYHAYFIIVAQAAAAKFAATFKDFPAIQKPNTFTIDDAMKKMSEAVSGD